MAQTARLRQPGAAAIAFMNTLAPAEARFSARARSARRPCRASATPRQANTRAAASGIAASMAAIAARWRVVLTIRYWAVKLTAAAAAASRHNPAAALRSQMPERSRRGPGTAAWPASRAPAKDEMAGPDSTKAREDVTAWPPGSRPAGRRRRRFSPAWLARPGGRYRAQPAGVRGRARVSGWGARAVPSVRCQLCPGGGIGWCAWQDAPERQDAVTTRQDRCWTCRDVPAKVKPSLYVLRARVRCRTRGCGRCC
jgi:hypothetical protein